MKTKQKAIQTITNNKGYTMAEVITAMAMAMLIVAALFQLIYFAVHSYTVQDYKSRQYVVVEQLEWLLSREVRYADELYITDEDFLTYGDGYAMIDADETGVFITDIDGERRLVIDDSLKNYKMRLAYDIDTETDVDLLNENNLFVTIYFDEGDEWELEETFNLKMLNMSLDDTKKVEYVPGASGERIVYKTTGITD